MNQGLLGYPATADPAPWAPTFSDIPTWQGPYGQENGTANAASGTLYCWMFPVHRPLQIDAMAFRIWGTIAGGTTDVSLAVYTDNRRFPRDKVTSGVIAGLTSASGTGFFATTVPRTVLRPGIYWAGLLQVNTSANVLAAQTIATGVLPRYLPWMVNGHGTGATPSANAGNDGVAAQQSSLTTLPGRFAGTLRNDANAPSGQFWITMKTAAAA